MLDALATAIPKKVWLTTFDEKSSAVKMVGKAASHEDVAEFMRALQSIVWTPRGIGRLIEQKRDAATARVELVGAEGAVEDFATSAISNFFTRVDLKKAEQKATGGVRTVDFEINMNANYAI
jgi:type IV pilus assembly protein PilN